MRLVALAFFASLIASAQVPFTAQPIAPAGTTGVIVVVAPASHEASWFISGGETSATDRILGVGFARAITDDQSIFGEFAGDSKTKAGTTGSVLFGIKTTLPAIGKFKPFALVSYGASIHTLLHLQPVALSAAGAAQVLTSIGQTASFEQRYGAGLQYQTKDGLTVGIGGSVDLGASTGRQVYPFFFIGRTFGSKTK
jgi:hypothetical protein